MSSIGTATVMVRRDIISRFSEDISEDIRKTIYCGEITCVAVLSLQLPKSRYYLRTKQLVTGFLDNSACHFTDPAKHYAFVKKGFQIADYFLHKYANNDERLMARLEVKKLLADLYYAFRTINREMAHEVFKKADERKPNFPQKMKAFLYLVGSWNQPFNALAKNIFKMHAEISG